MARDGQVRLWQLPTSHYSEKVRWALEHKRIAHTRRTPLAVPHFMVARALTRGAVTTFPVIELARFTSREGYRWVLKMYRRHRRAGEEPG